MKGSQIKSKIRRQNDIIKIEWKLIIRKRTTQIIIGPCHKGWFFEKIKLVNPEPG